MPLVWIVEPRACRPPRGLPVLPIVRDAAECVGVNFSSPVHPIQSHLVKLPSSHLTPLQNIRRTDTPSPCPRGRPASPPSSAAPVRHRQTFNLAHICAAAPTRSRIATCSPADTIQPNSLTGLNRTADG
ncbi:hypothetical protein DFH09DRAFT_1380001, partial [Mycena vulgaris]